MTKKQKENLASIASTATILGTLSVQQRYMIHELYNLFTFDQCERIFNNALLKTGKTLPVTKRKYSRKKKKGVGKK